jgi:hypothetical protein
MQTKSPHDLERRHQRSQGVSTTEVMSEGDSPEGRHIYCKIGQSVQRCCDHGEAEYLDIWLGGVEPALRGLHLYESAWAR